MTKFFATAAIIAVVGSSASAQTAQFSAAKAAAQKAVNAENAHTSAMQQPERAMSGSAAMRLRKMVIACSESSRASSMFTSTICAPFSTWSRATSTAAS